MRKKSGITEITGLACVTSAGTIGLQFAQGGINNVSEVAVTAFLTAAVPLVLQIINKKRSS